MNQNHTKLTPTDHRKIDERVISIVGERPTIDDIVSSGYEEHHTVNRILDGIDSAGKIITLIVAESIQSLAVLIIGVVFAILEYQRVQAGSIALGQEYGPASFIALAIVTANVIHPIYTLRALRGQSERTAYVWTVRGILSGLWYRIVGDPREIKRDWNHNSTLHFSAVVITITTVTLAVYDLVEPILTSLFEGTATKPMPILVIQLLMGLGLSVAGVYFLQSVSHEIGVRMLTDKPQRLTDVLEVERARYDETVRTVREQLTTDYMTAKIQDKERKEAQRRAVFTNGGGLGASSITHTENGHAPDNEETDFLSVTPFPTMNGNGNY